jgi:hypothetical protein
MEFPIFHRFTIMESQILFSAPPVTIDEALWEADRVRSFIVEEAYDVDFPAPPEGKWSIEDILYHLHLVERGSASAIRRVTEGDKGERLGDEVLLTMWQRMNKLVPRRSIKIPAPDGVSPKDTPSRSDCIRLLGESRARLHEHCSKTTTNDLLCVSFPHPVLGQVVGLYWITFIAMHEARHLEQIREIRQQGD